jgi:hypothetical protein
MLGEQICEEKGKVTLQRVLDISEDGDGATPKIETTLFSSNWKFKGIHIGASQDQAGWMLYGEAKGIVMSKDGLGEVVTFTAYGIGRFTSPGRTRFHGSVYYLLENWYFLRM